jgi:phage I-like protein
MSARIIYNRSGQEAAPGWYQIEVSGEHPADEGRTQVIDGIALHAIVNNFRSEAAEHDDFPGLLVDADHLSHDLANDTAALGWLKEVDIRNGQLHGRIELTDLGDSAVKGKRYKWFSTEYPGDGLEDLGNGRVRPKRLSGLAFTNRPNNRGAKPISNRSGKSEAEEQTNNDDMKNIAEKLGLPADADEAAILAKIATLMSSQASAQADVQNRGTELTTLKAENKTLREQLVETDIASFKDVIGEEKDAVETARELFVHNRESGIKIYTGLRERLGKGGAREPIYNRNTATPPNGDKLIGSGADEANIIKFRGIENRAHTIAKERGIGYPQAFEAAKAEAGV